MSLQEKLEQCKKDIEVLRQQKCNLEQQIERETPEFGDIVVFYNRPEWVRVILYTENGILCAFNKSGKKRGEPKYYRKTGRTIFDNLTD